MLSTSQGKNASSSAPRFCQSQKMIDQSWDLNSDNLCSSDCLRASFLFNQKDNDDNYFVWEESSSFLNAWPAFQSLALHIQDMYHLVLSCYSHHAGVQVSSNFRTAFRIWRVFTPIATPTIPIITMRDISKELTQSRYFKNSYKGSLISFSSNKDILIACTSSLGLYYVLYFCFMLAAGK